MSDELEPLWTDNRIAAYLEDEDAYVDSYIGEKAYRVFLQVRAEYEADRRVTAAEIAALKRRIAELKPQLAEQWTPLEDGEYDSQHTGSTFTIDGEWIKIVQRNILDPSDPFETEIAIDDCYRLCRRPGKELGKEEEP